MYRFLLAAILALASSNIFAQKTDSLFVSNSDAGWYIIHKVHPGETLFSLSRRYHVPPAMLADANTLSYNGDLTGKASMRIPIGAYNQAPVPVNMNEARAVYYRVNRDENLRQISKRAGVQQYKLQELNRLSDNNINPGQTLLTGYILYDATELPVVTNSKIPAVVNAKNTPANTTSSPKPVVINSQQVVSPVAQNDTSKAADTGMSKGEQLYLEQTGQGQNTVSEKGPAAFFPMSSGSGVYLAFHNTVPKGTIVKVHNPGNGKNIYVKIIGQLPANKKFYNTVIGISNRARAELGTVEQRLWVELSYAGY